MLALSACGANISLNPFTADETVTQSFTPAGTPRIVVEMFNGSVDVVTGSGNTVKVDVVKRGGGLSQQDAEDDLRNVEVTMTQDGDTIRVVAKRTDQRVDIGNSGASAKLRVPEGAILDLHSSNGLITSSGPVGDVKAQTSNGPIDLRGSRGPIDCQHEQRPDHHQRRQRRDRRRDQQRADRDYGRERRSGGSYQQRPHSLQWIAGAGAQ